MGVFWGLNEVYFEHLAHCMAPGKDLSEERPNYGRFWASLCQGWDWDPLKPWGLGKGSLFFITERQWNRRRMKLCSSRRDGETKFLSFGTTLWSRTQWDGWEQSLGSKQKIFWGSYRLSWIGLSVPLLMWHGARGWMESSPWLSHLSYKAIIFCPSHFPQSLLQRLLQ